MHAYTAVATAGHKLLHTCISSFHPIAKPCNLNPQIYFSEVILNLMIINKHHPGEKGLADKTTVNIAIHTINIAIHMHNYVPKNLLFVKVRRVMLDTQGLKEH